MNKPRKIAVVTVSRSDYGILRPVLVRLQRASDVELLLIAGGMHTSTAFGSSIGEIEADGFEIADRIEMCLESGTPDAIAASTALGVLGFSRSFSRLRPDMVVLLGDRYETHAAAVAALPYKIPVAHIAGGEVTEGSLDECTRHSISKMSHLHFVTLPEYARRLERMGEEPWRIRVTGSPSLDDREPLLSRSQLEESLKVQLTDPILLVTLHPETRSGLSPEEQARCVLGALEGFSGSIVITAPGNDEGGRAMMEEMTAWAGRRKQAHFVSNLGWQRYHSLMRCAAAMLGNSSSGIVEAPSYRLPVVNVGERQTGRPATVNRLNVPLRQRDIEQALGQAISQAFRDSLARMTSPFGDGQASERIVEGLRTAEVGEKLLTKRFYEAG